MSPDVLLGRPITDGERVAALQEQLSALRSMLEASEANAAKYFEMYLQADAERNAALAAEWFWIELYGRSAS